MKLKHFGFILVCLCSCNLPKASSHLESEAKICNQLRIDTLAILENKNLDTLVSQLSKTPLKAFNKFDSIPKFIQTFLDSAVGEKFSVANPGEEWQATDVILNDLPVRQLIYLGIGPNVALLTFYRGGIGKSERILIFQFDKNCITDFWCGGTLADLYTKEQILKYLKEHKQENWGLNTNMIYF